MSYSDTDLAEAIAESRSWRGVLRGLGLQATSAGSLRAARRRADAAGLDYSHFTGQRRWSDDDLAGAIGESRSWTGVMARLGLANGGYTSSALRAHAARLGVDCTHLVRPPRVLPRRFAEASDANLLRSAAPGLAVAWFQLRGFAVSWPLEPARYDLLAECRGVVSRVQVKTTVATGSTRGTVSLSASRRTGRDTYGHEEIDLFFVVDRNLDAYLIPIDLVAGRYSIVLSAYEACRVARRGDWLSGVSSP